LVFPSSRVLAGWWPQLAPLAPQTLAVGHLLLHHVEALVLSDRARPLDRFSFLILRALALTSSSTLADLDGRLHLGRQVVARVLDDLSARGLADGDALGLWRVTAAGTALVKTGGAVPPAYQRRAFHFRDAPQTPFMPFDLARGQPVAPPEGWRFDPAVLRRCVAESEEWKRGHGFPLDVREVLGPDASSEELSAWQRVVVDRPEHVVLVLAVVAADGEAAQLLGFALEPRGWQLIATHPALTMGPGWTEAFPEVAHAPSPEAWRSAWRGWCQLRGVPPAEVEACTLRPKGVLLQVAAPRELLARWPAANGAPGREVVWLLAGEGMMRTAARVELSV